MRRRELRLAQPRFVPLTREQEREAAALLAELLVDAARKRRLVASPGAFGSAFGDATSSVIPFPETRGKARDAA